MEILKKITDSGQDVKHLLDLIKLIEITVDQIDLASAEVEEMFTKAGLYQKNPNKALKKVRDAASRYVKQFDKTCCTEEEHQEAAIQYGELSDRIFATSMEIITSKN